MSFVLTLMEKLNAYVFQDLHILVGGIGVQAVKGILL